MSGPSKSRRQPAFYPNQLELTRNDFLKEKKMDYGWPQIVMIAIYGLNVGFALADHGKPLSGRHNVFRSVFFSALGVWILTQGGFF